MKNLKYTVVLALGTLFLASCSATSHVVDDDVYVSKNPQMSTTEEVNNVSSYENYRYRRDRGDSDTRYGRDNRMFRTSTSIFLIGGMNNAMFSPYYDPWRSGFAYSPFYDPFNPWNNWGYNNYWGYGMGYGYMPMSFYYNDYYSPWGYSPYGYGYGNPYCYNNNYNNYNPVGNVSTNYNTHYGARYSTSGVNNNRRGQSPEAKGLAVKPGRSFKAADPGLDAVKNSRSVDNARPSGRSTNTATRINSSEVSGSRTVSSGTGLSRNGKVVSTRSEAQRGSGGFDSNTGRGSIDSRSNSDFKSNNRSFEPSNSGTTRNSGTTTSPRSNGSGSGSGGSTINRRGGR